MNIYIYGSSEAELEQRSDYTVYFSPAEELMSQLMLAPESDAFVWVYDYPWNNNQNSDEFSINKFDVWNKKQQYILSIMKKTKRKVIVFNKSIIPLSSVLNYIANPEENRKNQLDISYKQSEIVNLYLGVLFLWGGKYWRTLECMESISLRPNGVKAIQKNLFTSASDEKFASAVGFLSNVDHNKSEVASLDEDLNLRFNEIATLTLMLQQSQKLHENEVLKNNKLNEFVNITLKKDAAIFDEKNQNLEKEIKDRKIALEKLKKEVSSKNITSNNYQKKISELSEALNESKKSLSCRFNELAAITNMLEKANKEVSNLKLKLITANENHEKIKNSFSWKATAPIRALSHPVKNKKEKNNKKINETIQLIRESVYFDSEWYLSQNPDVESSMIDPARHYLLFGGFENRDPSTRFSNETYLELHPDVKAKGINPLEHYIIFGIKENRKISY